MPMLYTKKYVEDFRYDFSNLSLIKQIISIEYNIRWENDKPVFE